MARLEIEVPVAACTRAQAQAVLERLLPDGAVAVATRSPVRMWPPRWVLSAERELP